MSNNQNPRGQGNQKPVQQSNQNQTPQQQQPAPQRKITQPHLNNPNRRISQPHKMATQPERPGPGIVATRGNQPEEKKVDGQRSQEPHRSSAAPTVAIRQPIRPGATTTQSNMSAVAVTKDGQPDRRYNENRNIVSPDRMRASAAVGVHRTKDGAPDRRYAENQSMTDREAEIERARHVLQSNDVSGNESG